MRLSSAQQQSIREEVTRTFGRDAIVRLFGSRTDDQARGGDIDIHIESSGTPAELLDRELKLQARLQRRLGERRIDIVVYGGQGSLRAIDTQARKTGIPL
ncbi:MAG: nucleotidyltransferase domain-containing protein [Nitrosospira sp.]|nr:nucleotidyltransferase domain-containing protein [Nitrosospira sp.]MDN5935181.1 nucleotidyltransferase domain-containing protein [Nitrosospira sp.]